jgi:hypothetical protein
MATMAMVDTYVRQLLLDEHGDALEVGDRGYVLPGEPSVRVGVVDGNHRTRRVLVTAVVLDDVEVDVRLLEEVNELNARALYGRYFVADGAVHVEDTVLADVLDPAALANAIGYVTWAAETQGEPLRERVWPSAPTLPGIDAVPLVDPAELGLATDTGLAPVPPPTPVNTGGYL